MTIWLHARFCKRTNLPGPCDVCGEAVEHESPMSALEGQAPDVRLQTITQLAMSYPVRDEKTKAILHWNKPQITREEALALLRHPIITKDQMRMGQIQRIGGVKLQ